MSNCKELLVPFHGATRRCTCVGGRPVWSHFWVFARQARWSTDFESVVYLEAPAVYVTITLTSKTKTAHEQSQAALAEFVKTYHVSTVKGAVRR